MFENFLAENSLDLEAITDEGVDLFFSTLQLTDHLSEVPCVVGYPDGTTLINGWDAGRCSCIHCCKIESVIGLRYRSRNPNLRVNR